MTKPTEAKATSAKSQNLRALALNILMEILEKDTMSHLALRQGLQSCGHLDKQQRAFLTRLVEGTVERRLQLDYILNQYSRTPVPKMKPVIRTILRMSVYQILFMDSVPDSAVCNEAVKLTAKRGMTGLKGFVNGLLRKISSEKEQITYPSSETAEGLSIRYSMPRWLVEKWLPVYGADRTQQMLQGILEERPLIVHVNASRQSREIIEKSLADGHVQTETHPYSKDAWILGGVDRLDALEAFQKGWIQPQDISSQLASSMAVQAMRLCEYNRQTGGSHKENAEKDRGSSAIPVIKILDVCAAPGGKSLYVADAAAALSIPAEVTSRDLTAEKAAMIEENVRRIGLTNLHPEVYDALQYDSSLTENIDVLIADLPCSGLGIMGRKNDIKYRMTETAMTDLAALQRQILSVIWQYVKPGGYLIYSTCTINEEENQQNLRWLQETCPFTPVDITPWLPAELQSCQMTEETHTQTEAPCLTTELRTCQTETETDTQPGDCNFSAGGAMTSSQGYLQLLPGIHNSDGFFFSVLQRKYTRS